MIQKLIRHIIGVLKEGFSGIFTDPESQVEEGPIPPPSAENLPMIAIHADKIEIGQALKETTASQPRPQEIRQEIPVDDTNPQGPYSLSKTPLDKTALCKIIFDKDTVTERQITLVENKDFTIDYQNATILFTYDISVASTILLIYSYVGVFTVREFLQDILIDVYDSDMANVEKWASLTATMILTNHDELLESYNFSDKTEYIANQYLASHTLGQVAMLDGAPDTSGTIPKLQLKFRAQGQIKTVKEIVGGFGLIEKIHSPGKTPGHPVDIDIGVE